MSGMVGEKMCLWSSQPHLLLLGGRVCQGCVFLEPLLTLCSHTDVQVRKSDVDFMLSDVGWASWGREGLVR